MNVTRSPLPSTRLGGGGPGHHVANRKPRALLARAHPLEEIQERHLPGLAAVLEMLAVKVVTRGTFVAADRVDVAARRQCRNRRSATAPRRLPTTLDHA